MSKTVIILIGIIVLAIITYFVVRYVYAKARGNDVAPEVFELKEAKIVYDSYNVQTQLLGSGGASILAFVNLQYGDRTGNANPNANAYMPLVKIDGAMTFEVSPNSAQLSVVTVGAGQTSTEIISVPPLPMQKWVFVAILRDGRRFDVMYNDQIVASHRLAQYPKVTSNPLRVGGKGLLGSAVNVIVAPYRMTPSEVVREMRHLSDTTGTPVASMTRIQLPPIPFTTRFRSVCIPGIPCEGVTQPPSDNLKAWYSPYN
jgi:hypothetical protein